MPVSVERELDCEWVVGRCKSYLERGDRHGAKAWILTARSLFPEDFAVQVCLGADVFRIGTAQETVCM